MLKKYHVYLQFTIMTNFHLTLKKIWSLWLYFAEQCTPLINDSKLPSVLRVYTTPLHFYADHIGDIIKKLDPNKAPGHGMISIRILKLCGDSIWKPLEIILKNCLKEGIFSDEWENVNVLPIHKNMTNRSYHLVIDMFPFIQFVLRYLNVLYKLWS